METISYWKECVSEALDDAGIVATAEQLKTIAAAVQVSHECYGQAFYQPTGNPLSREIAALKKELEDERRLVFCRDCNGTGRITTYGGTFQATGDCFKCKGRGKHPPR